jgi:RHH-type proline utilization regulon transcriptional repressor/proline dehydrogenase/delta 1-pyrroline-5-carboxylate dehydrogenase
MAARGRDPPAGADDLVRGGHGPGRLIRIRRELEETAQMYDAAPIDWNDLDADKYADEDAAVRELLAAAPLDAVGRAAVVAEARALVVAARRQGRRKGVMESFLEEFGLSNAEGLALMCLAEALLRIPDEETADALIAEKIRDGRWAEHLGKSDHWLVNAGTWGLMLTRRIVRFPDQMRGDAAGFMGRLVKRAGEPVVRAGAMQAMRILGEQFVLGRTIERALRRGRSLVRDGEADTFSFDMLGEGARTDADARRYLAAYEAAIAAVGAEADGGGPLRSSGVSVKLSALHPRYDPRQSARVVAELYPRLLLLAERAAALDVHLCLDAEEADRLVLSLELFERLSAEPQLARWGGLGLAVQAYQKRARGVIDRLVTLARARERRFMVRLVKGAYWDGEIKRAQQAGRTDYPVFTTKPATDVSYLVCARALLESRPVAGGGGLFPQFATHNAHTVAAVRELAREAGTTRYEFQRLHGMGTSLYAALGGDVPVRVYAPVGGHEELLPYLVRRLLENGANTSFVHTFLDDDVTPDIVAADPLERLEAMPTRHPRLVPPPLLYGARRRNSGGRDLAMLRDRRALMLARAPLPVARAATPGDAIEAAARAYPAWDACGGIQRAMVLCAMADALEGALEPLVQLIAEEGKRTLQDGIDEVREAVDACRYYAAEAERLFGAPERLPGPAGETNELTYAGRGVIACISPWNFPLAIFTGQLAAALAAGNAVVAKPAEQTPRIAAAAVRLFHDAGVPPDALQFVPGDGRVGAALVADARVAGVAFTGSVEVAHAINRSLAARDGPIPVLIAETGGLNGLFVDTTALREQLVDDAIVSAFGSAGQRCSSARVIFLPHETADEIIETLTGAMDALVIGDPRDPATDVGPVIDAEARAALEAHLERMRREARVLHQCRVPADSREFFGPALVELPSLALVTQEVFGPILHVVRYDPDDVAAVGAELAATGYGLTLGVHSRLESFVAAVRAAVPAGNVYVNRSMIGAVIGVQPFGGLGLSGTGPKTGGPNYVVRFATERVVTVNVAAQGGDPELLNL